MTIRSLIARRSLPLALAAGLVVCWGCEESSLEGLAGFWSGEVDCGDEVSPMSISIQVSGSTIFGTASILAGGSEQRFEVSGEQSQQEREVDCLDDSCSRDEDCASKGGGSCNAFGQCTPCRELTTVTIVRLTLKDDNIQIPDPVLLLERSADIRLEGTIEGFCSAAGTQRPSVVLEKQ